MSSTSAGAMAFVGFVVGLAHQAVAVEPGTTIKEGISAYSAEKFEEARNKFRSATEELEKSKSSESAVGSFDEACALHRNGEWDLAREAYLKAGLSRDRKLSTAAHFNLGTMLVERARSLAGDAPASVPSEKRQEILDFLTGSVTSFRHCLELQPDHQPSRRNIELVRSWIKYYSDQWREADRRKRRNETNVAQFLEYLMQTQLVLKGTVEQFTPTTRLDQYAEVKQVQQELAEEIPVLREKIGEELMPGSDRSSQGQSSADQISPEQKKQLEEAISLLQNWTDDAGKEMEKASVSLAAKLQKKATTEQQAAFDSLDKIWDAIVSFPPLLKKEHGDQHVIVQMLDPDRGKSTKEDKVDDDNNEESNQGNDSESDKEEVNETVELGGHQIEQLTKVQERVLKKARLLKPKAESELAQFEASEKSNRQVESTANDQPNNELPKPEKLLNDQEPNTSGNSNAETPNQEQIDPEQVKEGYRKAIELAPQAVEQMEQAYKFLEQNDAKQAATPAREAYRILDEIQKAQPKQKPQNDQNKSDEQQKSDDENDEDQKDEKGESNSDNRQKDSNQEPRERQPQEEMADRPPSHIEDVLRKLRERQQKKRENDRKMKVKGFGRAPVDKDW
ncbi:MAG: hypothetical protein FJ267_05880 [Planctomycetes bacterium]|nr:hypothetical protein [Planctomycetota bacterium]